MKNRTISPFTKALFVAIPLSLASCGGDKNDESSQEAEQAAAAAAEGNMSHPEIGQALSDAVSELMESVGSIQDAASGEDVKTAFADRKVAIQALLDQAKKLAPPTDEEKSAVQSIMTGSDSIGREAVSRILSSMATYPNAEETEAIAKELFADLPFRKMTAEIEDLYELDSAPKQSEDPPE